MLIKGNARRPVRAVEHRLALPRNRAGRGTSSTRVILTGTFTRGLSGVAGRA